MASAETFPVVIVGGGIGGIATAIFLAEAGTRVHVIEQKDTFGELGAGLQLAPNALRQLDRLDLTRSLLHDAIQPVAAVLRDARNGQAICEMSFGAAFLRQYGAPYIVTHRADLLASLLERAQAHDLITLETGKRVVSVESTDEQATVECADGSSYRAGLAVGADGLWSTLRQFTVGDGAPKAHRDIAYRGAVPASFASDNLADDAEMTKVVWWIGPGLHLIQYPIHRGELYNQVGVFRSAHPSQDPEDWGEFSELEERFSAMDARVHKSALLLDRERRWPLFDRDPVSRWTRGRVTLMGDAAHPMLQYLAQGAGQAIEDAACLADAVAAAPGDIDKALRLYEQARVARTVRIQLAARQMGEIVHGGDTVAMLRNELLRDLAPTDYRHVDWLYAHQNRL